MEILKVSSKSKPNAVAGAIAGVIREDGEVELQAVGGGAVNQAMTIAGGFVAPTGGRLVCTSAFANVEIDGENRTALRLVVTDLNRKN